MPSIRTFRMALYMFIGLMRFDYVTHFSCTECTSNPSVVICDGVALGFQLQQLRNNIFDSRAAEKKPTADSSFCKSRRIFLNNLKPSRTRLLELTSSSGLERRLLVALIGSLRHRGENAALLARVLDSLLHCGFFGTGDTCKLSRSRDCKTNGLSEFIRSLGLTSPVSAIVPYSAVNDVFSRNLLRLLITAPLAYRAVTRTL